MTTGSVDGSDDGWTDFGELISPTSDGLPESGSCLSDPETRTGHAGDVSVGTTERVSHRPFPEIQPHHVPAGTTESGSHYSSLEMRPKDAPVDMRERIQQVVADLIDLDAFYNISISPTRWDKISSYCATQSRALEQLRFESLDAQEQLDFLLLQTSLRRQVQRIDQDKVAAARMAPLLPFAPALITLCEARQQMESPKPKEVADVLINVLGLIKDVRRAIDCGKLTAGNSNESTVTKEDAYRAASALIMFQHLLHELLSFSGSYDPVFDWWVKQPGSVVLTALRELVQDVQLKLVGISLRSGDDIVGEPIGRDALLRELAHEAIAYTPDELIKIAKKEYRWCRAEMERAAGEMGMGNRWKDALEYVKKQHVEIGVEKQTDLVRDLAREAIAYVKANDLVTVPDIAADTWRMFMLSAAQQKLAPYFLGGSSILVASPTAEMSHRDKIMVLRSNNKHFSRATVFHELVPGHRLQLSMGQRHRPYRGFGYGLGGTPFYVEGWGVYWEMLFWNRGDFFISPEDRIGTLFWRMHRCARVLFSLSFHLGIMSARECVDLLVNWVGHERWAAEAEVRRSLVGGYPPLYQAAYLLGGLQLQALRREVLEKGEMTEKELHDEVLKLNAVPIELLRATLLGYPLAKDYRASWKFYDATEGKGE